MTYLRAENPVPSERCPGQATNEFGRADVRTVVETAYYAGIFDWPRESTGEQVAETLDVSAPAFQKHQRVAERKLFAALVGDESTNE
jgi:hypothetical protein